MHKPTNRSNICGDDVTVATSISVTTQSNIGAPLDTTEEEDLDELGRSPFSRSPVTFYIESESSKVGIM